MKAPDWTVQLSIVGASFFAAVVAGTLVSSRQPTMMLGCVVAVFLSSWIAFSGFARNHLAHVAKLLPALDCSGLATVELRHARILYFAALMLSGFLIVRPFAGFTLSDWLFLGSLSLVVFRATSKGTIRRGLIPPLFMTGIALFTLGAALSSFGAPSPIGSILVTLKFLYVILIWLWLGTVLIQTMSHLRAAMTCWVAGMGLSALAAFVQLAEVGTFWSTASRYGRLTGGADHPNDLGAQVAIALVPGISLLALHFGPVARVAATSAVLLLVSGMLLSGSVTSLITSLLCAGVWLGAMWRVSFRSIAASLLFILAAAWMFFAIAGADVATPIDRVESTTSAESKYCTSCSRLENLRLAWSAIQNQPLFGHGLDTEGSRIKGETQVHFMVLKAWYEAGVLGFLGMIVILASVGVNGWRSFIEAGGRDEAVVALALVVSFVATVIIGFSQPLLFQRYAWMPAAFILILHTIQQGRTATARSTESGKAVVNPLFSEHSITESELAHV